MYMYTMNEQGELTGEVHLRTFWSANPPSFFFVVPFFTLVHAAPPPGTPSLLVLLLLVVGRFFFELGLQCLLPKRRRIRRDESCTITFLPALNDASDSDRGDKGLAPVP